MFKASIKKVQKQSVTVRNSQECVDAISQATTHGNLFHATGGGHLTDEDVFLALQKKKVEAEIKQLKKKKDVSVKMGDVMAKANAILQEQNLYTPYTKIKLSVLLLYHQTKSISVLRKIQWLRSGKRSWTVRRLPQYVNFGEIKMRAG